MARCEQGYLCEVCGEEVEGITESDLYLAYVLGEVPAEELPAAQRHVRCNPERHQYIVDPAFEPALRGLLRQGGMDPDYVAAEEARSPAAGGGCRRSRRWGSRLRVSASSGVTPVSTASSGR